MLPKPEKTKKNSADQLDLVESLNIEGKVRKKRFLITIFLGLSVGLSICFSVYSSIKKNLDQPFSAPRISLKISLPKFDFNNLGFQNNITLDDLLGKTIGTDPENWKIFVRITTDNDREEYFVFPKDISEIDYDLIQEKLDKQGLSTESMVSQSLPPGVYIKENIIDKPYEVQELILVPKKKILMVFKSSGPDIESSKKIIPKLVEEIYWQVMQR